MNRIGLLGYLFLDGALCFNGILLFYFLYTMHHIISQRSNSCLICYVYTESNQTEVVFFAIEFAQLQTRDDRADASGTCKQWNGTVAGAWGKWEGRGQMSGNRARRRRANELLTTPNESKTRNFCSSSQPAASEPDPRCVILYGYGTPVGNKSVQCFQWFTSSLCKKN